MRGIGQGLKLLLNGCHPEQSEGSRDPSAALQPQDDIGRRPHLGTRSQYIHARHLRARCHEPKFQVEFPEADSEKDPAVPILKGKTPVRITLDPEDKDYLTANRFEVMFFADGEFLFEQEEGVSPLTIDLDSKRLGAGDHLLTINVMDYEDHIGVRTLKVKVTPKEVTHA